MTSSYSTSNRKEPIWLMIIRIALACVFLFSSFTKAVDPVNFGIKIDEYFISFGMSFMHPLSQFIAICAICCEFMLGCMMLIRVKMKLTSLFYLLFMSFFFLLTLWLAIAENLELHHGYNFGVVKDCGCFGQAVKLSNLQTFLKNVAIIIPTIILFTQRKKIPDVRLTDLGQWTAVAISFAIVLCFQLYCIHHLPVIDFTNWKKGSYIVKDFIEEPAQKDVMFIYKSKVDQSTVALTQDELMSKDDNFYNSYDYVDRKDSVIKPLVRAKIDGFNMLDDNGADHAYELINLNNDQNLYILFIHNLDEVNPKGLDKAKILAADCEKKQVTFVAITNDDPKDIKEFVKANKIQFPIYYNPIDPIKGPFMVRDAVRSNPGIILFNKGTVIDKWAWRDFPTTAEVQQQIEK